MTRLQAVTLALVLTGLGYALWVLSSLAPLLTAKVHSQRTFTPTEQAGYQHNTSTVSETTTISMPLASTAKMPAAVADPSEEPAPEDAPYIPPIASSTPAPVYSGDLSDHQAYQAYQSGEMDKMKQDYIAAVDKKVARLELLLEKGVRHKLPEQQLQEAREKIQGLRAMQRQLRKELAQ
ncbi:MULTISPECIES: hypothetical protein [unclassified Pseudoalteromonas]|uniref:hypothetical protein n=1 Tax=unclassified Pseudoalteromonas TaxID=194690 RepID=UPI0020977A05|nr:hypothetical protein [Pseudoalteromonas sp. XMcav2-N]MCO7190300.1 hypothetical protein [Pseudoalteromonas sp. XMcav2-N]